MYARLWWKETRIFWPIWVALGVIAAGVQWFLLWSQVPEARSGFLLVLGYGWSTLYAFAVGAGVLAAERESKTQVFLDTLPVSRRMQWTSKVSFALITTLGLTLALTALGAVGTAAFDLTEYPPETLRWGFGLVLLEGVAWSLLWSVVLASSLQAALTGLLTVGLLSILLSENTKLHAPLDLLGPALAPLVVPRLLLAGAALGFSWLLFTRGQHAYRSGLLVRRMLARPGPQLGRLVWETVRESRRIWLLLAGAWIGLPLLARLLGQRSRDPGLWVIFGVLTNGLAAGVSVFGAANRAQSYRFLAYHGVRPGVVWAARLLVWGIVVTGTVSVSALVMGLTWGSTPRYALDVLYAGFTIFEAFVIAVLAGQFVRRSITAWVVAALAFVLMVMPQFGLHASSMIPIASLSLFPLLVLMISWAWTGDWMNDLRGAARWFRLGGMMGGAAALLIVLYIGYRVLSVPDIGSPFPPRPAPASPARLAPDLDTASNYTQLLVESLAIVGPASEPGSGDSIVGRPDSAMLARIVTKGWDPKLEPVVAWWEARRGLIERIRRAAAKPAARLPQPGSGPTPHSRRLEEMDSLLLLLGLDNFERRSRGDLAGAWDDLRAAFQMANQICRAGTYDETSFALKCRIQALQWALVWAGDSRQTPAQLRAALAEFPALLPAAPVADSLEDEYTRNAHALQYTPDVFISQIVGDSAPHWSLLRALVAPWWERIRALRVLRLMTARQLRLAKLEPWQRLVPWKHGDDRTAGNTTVRDRNTMIWDVDPKDYLASTPLARPLPTNDGLLRAHDANTVLSRALEQVAALRIWQLEHGGLYPEALEALVPGILPSLPLDPYSGEPFRYRTARGQKLLPLGLSGVARSIHGETMPDRAQPTRPGQWLLYSVGPDGMHDEALIDWPFSDRGDLIFPLPPGPS